MNLPKVAGNYNGNGQYQCHISKKTQCKKATSYEWQPSGCPDKIGAHSDMTWVANYLLAGRKILLMGDSTVRNQYESLTCMLGSVLPVGEKAVQWGKGRSGAASVSDPHEKTYREWRLDYVYSDYLMKYEKAESPKRLNFTNRKTHQQGETLMGWHEVDLNTPDFLVRSSWQTVSRIVCNVCSVLGLSVVSSGGLGLLGRAHCLILAHWGAHWVGRNSNNYMDASLRSAVPRPLPQ